MQRQARCLLLRLWPLEATVMRLNEESLELNWNENKPTCCRDFVTFSALAIERNLNDSQHGN